MRRCLVQTFGCQMNVHDSQRIEELLVGSGYQPTMQLEEADLIVVNTCSIRDKAVQKLRSHVGRLRAWKEADAERLLVVAGCLAQQEGERLLQRMPEVDLLIGPDRLPDLLSLLADLELGGVPTAQLGFDSAAPTFLAAQPRRSQPLVSAFVTVMKGCDERCTFCVVPNTRGPERYRDADAIVAEVQRWVAAGAKEVVLLGQTVNSWYEPGTFAASDGTLTEPRVSQFAQLLRRIAAEAPGLLRLRYTSPHPRHVTAELVRAHAELELLPAHVHLPMQSGSDRMLRRMLRRYDRRQYLQAARALQSARPDLTLSTDLIVGFPGESEEDFQQTLSAVQEVGFVAGYAFAFSPRPQTPALKLDGIVPEEVKQERLQALLALLDRLQAEHLAGLVGQQLAVLVEGSSKIGADLVQGRSQRHEIVHLHAQGGTVASGALVQVRVERANRHSLQGSLLDAGEAVGSEALHPRATTLRRRALPLLPVAVEV